jgi:hypothetical protein
MPAVGIEKVKWLSVGFATAFGLLLLALCSCALSRTADEARIAGGVKVDGLVSELIGVNVGAEVYLRRRPQYETSCNCVGDGDIRVPL